ncbi:hypothetical protein VNI00_012372 [Paramarasmius palmivorus]|uniref:F-box domain-containing protein n=1 Tax=Paramarasmius palmivorus TaxID=297713 RepID=A0AAW0C6E8_9AGAR
MEDWDKSTPLPDSSFTTYFGTNYAPSPQEVSDIQQLLVEPEKELKFLDEEFVRVYNQRIKLKTYIDNHRSLLSPIRRVPVDIIREIFAHCLPTLSLPTANVKEAPLLLTRVCRSWREAAITTPCLWNSVHVSLPSPQAPPITDSYRLLIKTKSEGIQVWLGRSGSMPLRISLQALVPSELTIGPLSHIWENDAQSLLELQSLFSDFTKHLIAHASRWKSLGLNGSMATIQLPEGLEELGSLEELKLCRQQNDISRMSLEAIITRSPSLRVLHLENLPLELPIRWSQLTEIQLGAHPLGFRLRPFDALEVLRLCPFLHDCTLGIGVDVNLALETSSDIVLPCLAVLHVEFIPVTQPISFSLEMASQAQSLFDAIVAPMLKQLSATAQCIPVISPFTQGHHALERLPFHTFVERSKCCLDYLSLGFPVTANGILRLLNLIPSLSKVTFRRSLFLYPMGPTEGLPEVIVALTPTDNRVLCPNLGVLICEECDPHWAKHLIALAEARSVGRPNEIGRLRAMVVTFRSFVEDAWVPMKLQLLRERGMVLHWTSPRDHRNQLLQSSQDRLSRYGVISLGNHTY